MCKHKNCRINKPKSFVIKLIELAPLLTILGAIILILGFCAIGIN